MDLDRFSKLSLPFNKELPNRVVVPPMASSTASNLGYVTKATLKHYANLAESRAGLIMVEYTYVHRSGRSEENQLGIDRDDQIDGLRQIATLIHENKSLAGIQLTHAGGKTTRDLAAGFLMTPSSIAVPVKDQNLQRGDEMTKAEIDLWIESFTKAAVRASKAGFDLVELHAAHGYGLNQWLSPITNFRIDRYGVELKNRAGLLFEIVGAIRCALPEIIIAVRLPGQDFLENGLTVADTQFIAKHLENLGVSIIDVSSGIGGWKRPADRTGEGYLVSESANIQKVVSIPVIGVGGIESGHFIDQALRQKKFSLAAVGRAILRSPYQWGLKNLTR